MKKKKTMTSPIGNDVRSRAVHQLSLAKTDKRGFSFLEVMVAVMILSGGLVFIYKSFFTALEYTNHLTIRLQANILLDEKIATLKRLLEDQNQLTLAGPRAVDQVIIANRPVNFQYTLDFRDVENLKGLFLLDISIGWMEGTRRVQLSREVYLSSLKPLI